jgi:hypothetical protein
MPRGCGRWVVAAAVALGGVGTAVTVAAPPEFLPRSVTSAKAPSPSIAFDALPVSPYPPPKVFHVAPGANPNELKVVSATEPPGALPPVAPDSPEPPIKDLTPPGFATDWHPLPPEHPAYRDAPGHLTPAAPDEGGPFASAEFLLFRPRRGAFDFAIPGDSTGLVPSGPIQTLNYELRGGVRAELGYRLGQSGWDVLGSYTYFRSNAFGGLPAAPGQVLFPTLTRPGLTDTVQFAAADANLEYNTYDLNVGKRFAVDDYLALRVYGGMRFASIRQGLNAYYDGLDARAATVSARSNFEGFGPLVGGEMVFAGWKGFHLYARANGGFLTGLSQNPLVETNNAGHTTYANTAYDVRKVVPVAGVGFGAGWQYRTVSIRAGYEIINYFNLTDQPRLVDDLGPGKVVTRPANLSLEGLFVRLGLRF